jgi:peptidoglycan/LPS O-acetylase OafA/YrhL
MAIFFTLSGYVIALSYSDWNWRERPAFNLVRLFFYRFARLYPAYFVFFVLIVLRSPPLRDLSDPQAQAYLLPHLVLAQAWFPVKYGGALAVADYFHVSWSLSTECALYLMFGLGAILAALLPGWRYKPLVLGVAFFTTLWLLLREGTLLRSYFAPAEWSDPDWYRWFYYISPYAIALQFGIGVAAYKLSRLPLGEGASRILSNLGAAGLVATYFLITGGMLRDEFDQAMPTSLATGFLMVGALSNSVANRLLSGRGIVYIGTISYSLYLFHFLTPSMGFHGQVADFDTFAKAYQIANYLVALALAIMLATGVYRLVEVPGRRAIRAAADRDTTHCADCARGQCGRGVIAGRQSSASHRLREKNKGSASRSSILPLGSVG